jgi:hypothetical protein
VGVLRLVAKLTAVLCFRERLQGVSCHRHMSGSNYNEAEVFNGERARIRPGLAGGR